MPSVMAETVCALGFAQVELGYFTRDIEVEWWRTACAETGLSVSSLHAFCPVPIGMPQLGPEMFSIAALDRDERAAAMVAMIRTLECAVAIDAKAVVTHGGRVELRQPGMFFGSRAYRSRLSQSLRMNHGHIDWALVQEERRYREMHAERYLDAVSFSLEQLLPRFEEAGVVLAFENLPGIEAFPDPAELQFLRQRFPTSALGAWYDIGHGERKARVGDWPVHETLHRTHGFTIGTHIHDVRDLEEDHCAPGEGTVDYLDLLPLLRQPDLIRVFEPAPTVTHEALRAGREWMERLLSEEHA